jgi:segregation and condensation protein A
MKPELKLVENTGSMLEQNTFETPPQQTEMPFAIVEGEPITELPKDLYIPPDALQVFLEAFEGPLDLLLYLIRRQNLDILDIPIAEITRQYMQYIEVMAELQLELAGEYLLMAAMLAEIKSRMLLPRPKTDEGQEEEDPRAELVRRLQEYERFKKAAEDLDRLPRMERDTLIASAEVAERKVVRIPPKVTLQEMLLAFRDVLQRAELFAHHHIARERLSVRQRMTDILSALRETAFVEFVRLFRAEEGRMGVTVTFIAMLELMKEGLIEIVQAEPYAPIHVRPASGARHLTVVADNESAAAAARAPQRCRRSRSLRFRTKTKKTTRSWSSPSAMRTQPRSIRSKHTRPRPTSRSPSTAIRRKNMHRRSISTQTSRTSPTNRSRPLRPVRKTRSRRERRRATPQTELPTTMTARLRETSTRRCATTQ